MHVAIASHYRLPVTGYGGTERVVVALARGLRALGHRVTLLAAPGTTVPEATVVPVPPSVLTDPSVDLATLAPVDADILHAHFLLARPPSRPYVQTLHGHLPEGAAPPPFTIFVSRAHAAYYRREAFVHNGLDPADYEFGATKGPYDLFLGRLHRVKGYRWAIAGAWRSGRPLIVAGGWRPTLRRGVRFLGAVAGPPKLALLAGARCLWAPALWEEPFGLTAIEALFSGTPVLGTRRGALPEIVSPEVGALGDSLEELIAARAGLESRSPAACRAHAERGFTHRVMAAGYVRMYAAVLEQRVLPAGATAASGA
jgi:glycosyltransferase involved in cell wall biosynthesis